MIEFKQTELEAVFKDAAGCRIIRALQVRNDPVTQRQSRVTPSRALENERGADKLYRPPDTDLDETTCPFCADNLAKMTPCLSSSISDQKRLRYNDAILFPNLFPYTEWSAVSIFDKAHHVEIGTAPLKKYQDSFINCARYLTRVKKADPASVYMSITQNHLPGAGGSLVHPHLQVHATRQISNNHQVLKLRAREYKRRNGGCILSDLLLAEKHRKERYIGSTGSWQWVAAFAPSGFHEIWGIAPEENSLCIPGKKDVWRDLAQGVLNTQKFYKSLNRNSYNLALLSFEDEEGFPCLRVSLTARSNYAPWVRSDFTGFEISSGEMATFTLPETTADMAAHFWGKGD